MAQQQRGTAGHPVRGFIAGGKFTWNFDPWAVCARGQSVLASAWRTVHYDGVEGIENSLLHVAWS